jgi:NAD(P)-dependent dehydrogenase (short-subunit alcohol dehydrogenase family)
MKVAIVTGSNIGIGYHTAKSLLLGGDFKLVVMACRSLERGNDARRRMLAELASESESQVDSASRLLVLRLDLSSLRSVDEFASEFLALNVQLNVLVLNAGVLPMTGDVVLTDDGFERAVGVNHLAHFLLFLHLLEALVGGGKMGQGCARVVALSSMVHAYGHIDFDDLNRVRSAPSAQDLYAQSKLANVLFAYELSRRYRHLNLMGAAVHPGVVSSDILKEANCFIRVVGGLFMRVAGKNASQGAAGSIMAATSPQLEGVGAVYIDQDEVNRSSDLSYDADVAARLWRMSAALTKARERVAFDYDALADVDGDYPVGPARARRRWPIRFVSVSIILVIALISALYGLYRRLLD